MEAVRRRKEQSSSAKKVNHVILQCDVIITHYRMEIM